MKTRIVVAVEGKSYPPGVIKRGALVCNEEKIPVTLQYVDGDIIGVATDFQRNEETGEISFDVEPVTSAIQVPLYGDDEEKVGPVYHSSILDTVGYDAFEASVYIIHYVADHDLGGGIPLITEGEVRAITMTPLNSRTSDMLMRNE